MAEWRDIPGYPGYQINREGQIRNLRTKRITLPISERRNTEYPMAYLCKEGKHRAVRIHSLLAVTFIGPCPPGAYVLHGDDVKKNCAIDNLRYGTPMQNHLDAVRNGKFRGNTST